MENSLDEESRALSRVLGAELADEERDMVKMETLLREAIRHHGCRHTCLSPLINALAARDMVGKAVELMGVAYGGRRLSSECHNPNPKPNLGAALVLPLTGHGFSQNLSPKLLQSP